MANPTLLDVARRTDANGNISQIAELLSLTNEILIDMPWQEGNLPTGHKITVRTGLPTVSWRKLNYGVAQSKSTTQPVTDTCGMLEAYAQVDKDVAELNGNTKEFRLSEDIAFIEAMNQTMATTLFYGDVTVDEEKFTGLAPRFSAISATKTDIGYNVISAGGSGADNTSMWLVAWGPHTVYGIYPKGSKAGLIQEDLGLETVTDGGGGLYRAYRSHYQWKCGVTVKDWRYIVRIANIDISDLATAGDTIDTSCNLLKLMNKAKRRLPNLNLGKAVFYANEEVVSALETKLIDKPNMLLNISDMVGVNGVTGPTLRYSGIPVRRSDAILLNETVVS